MVSGKKALFFSYQFFQKWQKYESNVGLIFDYIFKLGSKFSFGIDGKNGSNALFLSA